MAEGLRIRLLGGFEASSGNRVVARGAWRLRKAKTLIKLLTVAPGHALHRDQVLDALWPDLDPVAARNNLNQAVHAARRALGTVGVDGAAALVVHDDLLAFGRDIEVATDLDELQRGVAQAIASGRRADATRLLHEGATDLLPEDAYEPWARPHAEAWREWRTDAVMTLAEAGLGDGDAGAAVVLLTPVLEAEPMHEPATRAMMRALVASGRRSEALLLYDRLRNVLREELGADPEPATRELFRDLLTTAPAAVPAPRSQGNLPYAMTALVGRTRELAETKAILDRVRLLTLTGLGGAGKTTLAIELARRAAPDFSGAVELVELGAVTDGEQVAHRIAQTLHLEVPADAAAVGAVVTQLKHRRMLLVLDNCEHLLDACARVVTELLRGCPEIRVLATSREPLHIEGEVAWRTPSLDVPEVDTTASVTELATVASVELFVRRATAAQPEFALTESNAAAVAEICYRLDGIPLALELAASCIPLLSPQEIAARLGDSLSLLRRGGRSNLTRQQTLEATLSWSHDLLGDDERVLLRRLSVFAGSFPIEAAESVCGAGIDGAAVLSALARLVDTSLVSAEVRDEVTRYRLLETVRQYAAARLRQAGELQDVAERHCRWYVRLAEARDPERSLEPLAVTPASLDVEHDNLRAALTWALAHRPSVALHLAGTLWRYWLARGLLAEGRSWIEAALDAAPDPSLLRARALIALAVFDVRRGTDRRLAALGAEAVSIHRSVGNSSGLAQALHADAVLAYMRGSWDEAWQRSIESAEVAAEAELPQLEVAARHLQAIVLMGRGRLPQAGLAFDAVTRALDRIPRTTQPFLPPVFLGFAVERAGTASPRMYFEETVLLGRLAGVDQARGYVLCNLADHARLRGDLDEALRLLDAADAAFTAIADRDGEALVQSRRGCVHRVRGEFAAGRAALDQSLHLRRIIGDRRGIALAQSNLGLLCAAEGDVDAGRAMIDDSLRSAEEFQDGAARAGLTFTLASVCADAGDDVGAVRNLTAALTGSEHIPGNARATAWGHVLLADVLRRIGRDDEAARALAHSQELFDALGAVRLLDLSSPAHQAQSGG